MVPTDFKKMVTLYKRDPVTSEFLLQNEQKQPVKDLGEFLFRVPTARDQLRIEIDRQALLSPIGDPKFVTENLFIFAQMHAIIPRQVAEAPKDWNWEQVDQDHYLAVYETYLEGLAEVRGKNGIA